MRILEDGGSFGSVRVDTVDLDDRRTLREIGRNNDLYVTAASAELTKAEHMRTYGHSLHLANLLNLMSSRR